MSIGEKTTDPMPLKKLIQNAITVLSGRRQGNYAKGIMAYDAWKRAITDESQFPKEPILPILVERLMCQGDAMDCLADGRDNARKFFEKLADQNPEEPLFREIASKFRTVAQNTYRMYETLGGWQRDEKQLKALTKTENRLKIAELIEKCKAADSEPCNCSGSWNKGFNNSLATCKHQCDKSPLQYKSYEKGSLMLCSINEPKAA